MIYNTVTMIIKPGMLESFLAEAKKIREIVIKEKGCLMYDYTVEIQSNDQRQEKVIENRITLYEKWESMNDLEAHSKEPHMKEFAAKIAPMRESVLIRCGKEAF